MHGRLPSGLRAMITLLRCDPVFRRQASLRSLLNEIQSTEALKKAILEFPSVVPLLADKAEISLSSEARSQPAFRIFTHHGFVISSYAFPFF